MLTGSNVSFLESSNKIEIKFETKNLEKDFLRFIVCKKSKAKFVFDTEKLKLVYPDGNRKMALLYNVDFYYDEQVGWSLNEMCVTSEKLGFILSPMSEWHRERVINLYNAIMRNDYEAYIDYSYIQKGNIYLRIKYRNI